MVRVGNGDLDLSFILHRGVGVGTVLAFQKVPVRVEDVGREDVAGLVDGGGDEEGLGEGGQGEGGGVVGGVGVGVVAVVKVVEDMGEDVVWKKIKHG